ncbi:GMC family oxidoreductase [Rhizobium sp. 2YAF20]|uniref:GMC family oxidoreductase n=1 Tax=Rhizobium sp. 2YAF20 TaxID=3233027 RepID=UPI003F97B545
MAKKRPHTDVVLVGFGWTGALMAQQLTDAGLDVLALERGSWRDTATDFAPTFIQDELRYRYQGHLFEQTAQETVTFRNAPDQTALPMRRLGSFLPGTGVGGSIIHWNGQTWRFLPYDFEIRSRTTDRYGAQMIPEDMTLQDWGVTYDELEPYYTLFEDLSGISGQAGNLGGVKQPGGNPFEGPRSKPYPTPPMQQTFGPTLFGQAAQSLGLHPFPCPSANMSQAYTNPLGVTLAPCTYCGFCEKFGCGNYSKASAQTTILPVLMKKKGFTVRTDSEVLLINRDSSGTRATGVTYVDRQGEEFEQPADMVIVCAYITHNVRLLLLSGIGDVYDPATGRGTVGKNYCYQMNPSVNVFYDDRILNPFIGAGALGMIVDDWNGDNFDHTGLGFIHGGYISGYVTTGRPIETELLPKGVPKWGAKWKQAFVRNYLTSMSIGLMGAVMPNRTNHLDLDPTYRDVHGRPLMRMTYDFKANELKMQDFAIGKMSEIAKAMQPREIAAAPRGPHYDIDPYQTTHNTGGAIMGSNPSDSVVNRYLQHWQVPNLFVVGSSAFPHNSGYNPTGTVSALALWSADAIKNQYLKHPGPLVQA